MCLYIYVCVYTHTHAYIYTPISKTVYTNYKWGKPYKWMRWCTGPRYMHVYTHTYLRGYYIHRHEPRSRLLNSSIYIGTLYAYVAPPYISGVLTAVHMTGMTPICILASDSCETRRPSHTNETEGAAAMEDPKRLSENPSMSYIV